MPISHAVRRANHIARGAVPTRNSQDGLPAPRLFDATMHEEFEPITTGKDG